MASDGTGIPPTILQYLKMCMRPELIRTKEREDEKRFNDLCTKVHDVESHLNKCKKCTKESGGEADWLLSIAIAPSEKAPYSGLVVVEKPIVTKPEH